MFLDEKFYLRKKEKEKLLHMILLFRKIMKAAVARLAACKRGLMELNLFKQEWFSEAILLITKFLPKQIDFRMGVFGGHFIKPFTVLEIY